MEPSEEGHGDREREKCMSGPAAMSYVTFQLSKARSPIFGADDRVSAPNFSKRRLSITTARPKVLRSGTDWPIADCVPGPRTATTNPRAPLLAQRATDDEK